MDSHTRRRVLQATGVSLVSALAGCASVIDQVNSGTGNTTTPDRQTATESTPLSGKGDGDEPSPTEGEWTTSSVDIEEPRVQFSDVPIPEDSDSRYAVMGAAEAPVATIYGNWKCPYTQEFVLLQLPDLIDEYVRPGDVAIRFRSLAYLGGEPFLGPDAPRSTQAGLAVWDIDPETYWNYFAYVFENQPQERYDWGQRDLLLRYAEEAGVRGRTQIGRALSANAYAGVVSQTTAAAGRRGITTVPRVVTESTVSAPTVDIAETREQLNRLLDGESRDRDD